MLYTSKTFRSVGVTGTRAMHCVIAFLAFAAVSPACSAAQHGSERRCPLAVDKDRRRVEIVDVKFVDEVPGMDGNRMAVRGDTRKKFRIAVVTLKISKPAKEPLTIAAADLTLHYYHGDKTEVAACEGLSVLTNVREADRPVKMPRYRGPGFVKQKTGTVGTKSETVFVDAVFSYIEPEISDIWIAVAQPTTVAPFTTAGWKSASR